MYTCTFIVVRVAFYSVYTSHNIIILLDYHLYIYSPYSYSIRYLLRYSDRSDISPYSARKGSRTYCGGQLFSPNDSALELRMGHLLGPTKTPYIFPGDATDALAGRIASLQPGLENTFATLPAHFPPEILEKLTVAVWREIIGGFDLLPVEFKSTLPFLWASIIFHETWLRETLSPQHPLWSSRIFTQNPILEEIRGKARTGILSDGGLCATGIPPHISISIAMSKLEREFVTLKTAHEEEMRKLVIELPTYIATKVVEDITSNLTVNGAVPVTPANILQLREGLQETMLTQLRLEMNNLLLQLRPAAASSGSSAQVGNESWWKHFDDWGDGKFWHYVPKGWSFPKKLPLKAMWDLWYYGDRGMGIRPYRLLVGGDIKKVISNTTTERTWS
jgi:hypothetical protein